MSDVEKLLSLIFPFDEPTSRLYHVNILATALLLSLFAIFKFPATQRLLHLKKWMFNFSYWWNASTRQDYFLFLFNGLLKALLLIPLFEISFQISYFTLDLLLQFSVEESPVLPPKGIWIGAFTLFAFIWDDFLRFAHHWLMHQIPWLWQFHKTHHSARILTPFTLYRAHPIESLLAILRNSLSLGVSTGIFIYLFNSPLTVWTILGVNGFGFLFNLFAANLRHSQIPLSFGILENLIISPKQHQLHHSKATEHFDKNFGVTLALWDLMLGSLVKSSSAPQQLHFGLPEPFNRSMTSLLLQPFISVFKISK